MKKLAQEDIINVLKQCYDPEIPVDLWNLGLIYDIAFDSQASKPTNVEITMSLTTPGCGMGQMMADDIRNKLEALDDVNQAFVEITFEPPWTPEMMKEEAKSTLGFEPKPREAEESESWE